VAEIHGAWNAMIEDRTERAKGNAAMPWSAGPRARPTAGRDGS
jgi:hypothetical protein